MTGPGEAESAVQDRLPVKKDDKKHCLTPNVWINGKCLGDPRGTKDSDAERKKACRGGEQSKSCKSFKQKQVSAAASVHALVVVRLQTIRISARRGCLNLIM